MALVKCPTCGKQVSWTPEERWRPFCSERCRMIDLGAWADGSHAIPCEAPEFPDLALEQDSGLPH